MKSGYPNGYHSTSGVLHPDDDFQEFNYTDGEAFEKQIADIIAAAKDRSLFSRELIDAIWDWRSSCHLSPGRANLLRPLEHLLRDRVLELGAGCGPITRYLGELGGDVVALEASAFRAGVIRQRTSDLPNVAVVCDRIENFNPILKFDVVTMIGVLQYSRMFASKGAFAEMDLLKAAAGQIKPNGVVVLSIQNKLGLKYLAGFPEPNVGVPYFGIENNYAQDTVIRFSLDELKEKLSRVGLKHHSVFFPMPDYHMPVALLTSRATLPESPLDAASLLAATVGHDRVRPDWRRPNFSLERAWETLDQSGMLAKLANAFLVVAGKSSEAIRAVEGKDLAWHYATGRHPGFATGARFVEDKGGKIIVQRFRLTDDAAPTVPISQKIVQEPYRNGRLWWLELVAVMNRPGWNAEDIARWATPWIDALLKRTDIKFLGSNFAKEVDGSLFDATPTNLIQETDKQFHFFDQEWTVSAALPLGFIVFRGLLGSLTLISSCARPQANTPLGVCDLILAVLRALGVSLSDQDRDDYLLREVLIQKWVVTGRDWPKQEALSADLEHFRRVKLDSRPALDVVQAEAIIANRDLQLAEYGSELTAVNTRLTQLHSTLVTREAQIAAISAALADRDSSSSRLMSAITESHQLAVALNSSLAMRDIELAETRAKLGAIQAQATGLNSLLAERDLAIAELLSARNVDHERIAAISAALADRDSRISTLMSAITESDQPAVALNLSLAMRDIELAETQAKLVASQAQATGFDSSLAERDLQVAALRTDIDTIRRQSDEQKDSLAASTAQNSELQRSLDVQATELEQMVVLLADLKSLVSQYRSALAESNAKLVAVQTSLASHKAQAYALESSGGRRHF